MNSFSVLKIACMSNTSLNAKVVSVPTPNPSETIVLYRSLLFSGKLLVRGGGGEESDGLVGGRSSLKEAPQCVYQKKI